MRLQDFGINAPREWFQQLLDWSRKKITFEDNLDCQILTAKIGVNETAVGHSLGRTPRLIIEAAAYPNGTAGIQFTREPTNKTLWLKRAIDGQCTLILM